MIERVMRAVKLDPTLYQEVDADDSKTGEALMVAVGAALVGGLLSAFGSDGSIASWIGGAIIGVPIGLAIFAGITLIIGKMFGGEASFMGLFRTLGYASAPNAASLIPVLGPILALWGLATAVVGVRESHKISTGQAVATVLIPAIILFGIIFLFFAAIIGAAGLTALSG